MQEIFKIPFLFAEKIVVQLGRTPIFLVTLARLALLIALTNELSRMVAIDPSLASMSRAVSLIYLGWNVACIGGLLLFSRWELLLRPMVLLIDFLLCATLVVLFRPLELATILTCLVLLWACHERLGKTIAAIAAFSFILAFLFRGHYEPLARNYSLQLASDYTDSATIFIGCLITLAVIGSFLHQAQVSRWSDQLLLAGGNLNVPPIAFLMQQVAVYFGARAVYFIWEDMNDTGLHCSSLSTDGTVSTGVADQEMRALLNPRVRDLAFLFAARSDRLFFRNNFGGLKFSNSPEFIDALNELLRFRRGASFAVNAGPLRGRFFLECRHKWSPSLLDQCDHASESVDGFFERSFFLNAWRDRAFAEARLALSGDLHDSILQTLAAMRMRFSTLLPKVKDVLPADTLEDLTKLQDMIIAEQARLRQVLNESKQVNGVTQNLAQSLQSCAEMLSGQWNIECHAYIDEPDAQIDRSTAIEVEFLVREAVANAVQHAGARQVTIAAAIQDHALLMAFRNDSNNGHPINGHAPTDGIQSQSLARRLKLLGGTAYFDNINDKTLLSISIPLNFAEKRV